MEKKTKKNLENNNFSVTMYFMSHIGYILNLL